MGVRSSGRDKACSRNVGLWIRQRGRRRISPSCGRESAPSLLPGVRRCISEKGQNADVPFSTSSNSVPAATWFLLETLQDPQLRNRVSEILPLTALPSREGEQSRSVPTFDTLKLCSDPLLQSLYAETLRLRVAVLVVREPSRDDFSFRGWHIKRNEILSVSTRNEAMNKEIWNTGGDGDPHPLDTMWADRFIVDPQNPSSGPLRVPNEKRKRFNVVSTQAGNEKTEATKPYFSMDGLSASWIPYGGGSSLCPGRHFAKQEIITTAAILLTAYEMELVGQDGRKRPQVDMSCFGFGTMPPDRAIPFRIRRRRD